MDSVPLKDGQEVRLQVLDHDERSVLPDLDQVREFISQPRDPWFQDRENTTLFARSLSREEFPGIGKDYLFLARLNQEAVGSAWYQVADDSGEVGACAFVFTHPSQRGRGVAHELMKRVVSHFRERGGLAMYLGTSNPVARGVYGRVGFRVYNGVVMRHIDPSLDDGEFDGRFFSESGPTRVRRGTWGDLSRLIALYTLPHPWFIKDYGGRVFSHPTLPLQRCVTIAVSVLLRSEMGSNRLLVMEDSRKRLVGSISVYSSGAEKDSVALDFLVLPSSMDRLPDLLDEGCRVARSLGCKRAEAFSAEFDRGKADALRRLGFSPARSLDDEALPSGERVGIQVYRAPL